MLTTIDEQNHRYAIIDETFEHSEIPLFWCRDGKFIMLNHSFCTLTGFEKEDLLAKHFDELTDGELPQLSLADTFTPTTEREVKIFAWVLKHKNGTPISVELRLTRFYLNGAAYYFGLVRNLSKKGNTGELFAENLLRLGLAMQVSRQGMWEWNVAANETFYSEEYYSILGYENEAFVPTYKFWAESLHPDDMDTVLAIWDDFVQSDRTRYSDEFRLKQKNGDYIWVHSEGMVINRDAQGKTLRMVGIVADINEKKLNELRVQEQTQKLVDYAFFNSHRLRAPLSSILGLAELLKHEYSPEIVDSLDKVSKQLDEVVHEINQILVGDTSQYKLDTQSPIKKVSLVGGDKIFHVVYKKTFERYAHVQTTSHEKAAFVLQLMKEKVLDTDLIILDMHTGINVWEFLEESAQLTNKKPVYLLTNNITMEEALRASQYECVKGILLKPMGKQAILDFISQANN